MNMIVSTNNKMKNCFRLVLNPLLWLVVLVPSLAQAEPEVTLPEGTRVTLQLNSSLSTRKNRDGDAFTADVTKPVNLGDRTIIPKGTVVNCSITRIMRGDRVPGKAQMNLRFQSIDIPGHKRLDIVATLVKLESQGKTVIRSEGVIESQESAAKTAGNMLAPIGVGAGLGAVFGGKRGVVIGAGAGAAVGMAIINRREKDIELHRGSTLEIELNRPLTIPATEEAAAARNR
jgi:hypothetical protein